MTEKRMGFQDAFVRLLAETIAKSRPPEIGKMSARDAIGLAAIRGRWIDAHHYFQQHDRLSRGGNSEV